MFSISYAYASMMPGVIQRPFATFKREYSFFFLKFRMQTAFQINPLPSIFSLNVFSASNGNVLDF